MAINFPNGFQVTSNEPIDSRLVLTKTEMLALKKAKMPTVYLTVCSDDGQIYVYNSANDIDSETGRFRVLKTFSSTVDKETLQDLISQESSNILYIDGDGNLKVEEAESISQDTIRTLFQKEETENG